MVFRSATRGLIRSPGTAVAAIVTLTVGIAACTSMFTLLHSLLWRPLPFPEPERLATMKEDVSWGDIREMEDHARTVEAVAAFRRRTWGFTDASRAPLEVVLSGMVTHGFFDALRMSPERGVAFTKALETPGANRVIWLTHDFWVRRYGESANVLGSAVELNDVAYRIAGILPAKFHFPMEGDNPDVFIPLDRSDYCCARDARTLGGIVRLAAGASRDAASAEISRVSGTRYGLIDLQTSLLGDRKQPLLLLALASGLLMLVSAANAAAILLARAAREMRNAAVKASFGAQWWHLAKEQIAQGFAIGSVAALFGFTLASVALRSVSHLPALAGALDQYRRISAIQVDGQVAMFAFLIALGSAIFAALLPVGSLCRASLEQVMRASARSKGSHRGRNALVISQVALSTILLCMGALIVQHLREVLNGDKGFRTDQLVLAGIGIPEARYDTDEKMIRFHERVIANLRQIPGVEDAGGGAGLPFGRPARFLPGGMELPMKDRPKAVVGVVSPGMLSILGVPLVAGREFAETDRYDRPWVALLNRRFLARYGRGVGARLRVGFWNGHMKPWTEFQVVGIVGDARNRDIDLPPEPAIYLSSLQVPMEGFFYFAKTALPASSLTAAFRNAVWSVDRNIEAVHPRPFAPYAELGLESRRLMISLLGGFGLLALLLAMAGLAASASAWVTDSRKELGIRAALGEQPAQLRRRVLRRSVQIAFTGAAIGILGAILAGELARNRIAGLGSLRVAPILAVGLAIALMAIPATWLPARRAARLDPNEMLRRD